MILHIILIIWLCILAMQDFKYRAVSWYLFPVGLGILLLQAFQNEDGLFQIHSVGVNLGFVLLQLTVVTGYLSIKHRRVVNICKDYLGFGDILFLLVITLAFSPINFIIFTVLSLLFSLIGFMLFSLYRKIKYIPLAGAMAIFMIFIIVAVQILPIDMHSDQWIINLLV